MYRRGKIGIFGSITVESAFIIPIVLGVIFIFIYLAFYMHDVCIVQSIEDEVTSDLCHMRHQIVLSQEEISGTNYAKITQKITSQELMYIREEIQNKLRSKMFLMELKNIKIDISMQKKVLICVETQVHIPIFILGGLFEHKTMANLSYGEFHTPVMNIRKEKMIYEEFQKTKMFDCIKEYLGK